MVDIVHFTSLDAAVGIMKEGFYPRRKSVVVERGANFHLADRIYTNNQNSTDCGLLFDWRGPISKPTGDVLDCNVLYNYESWRHFIKDCNENLLNFKAFRIREDVYAEYNATETELIEYDFSRKRACDAFFSQHIGRFIFVNSSEV